MNEWITLTFDKSLIQKVINKGDRSYACIAFPEGTLYFGYTFLIKESILKISKKNPNRYYVNYPSDTIIRIAKRVENGYEDIDIPIDEIQTILQYGKEEVIRYMQEMNRIITSKQYKAVLLSSKGFIIGEYKDKYLQYVLYNYVGIICKYTVNQSRSALGVFLNECNHFMPPPFHMVLVLNKSNSDNYSQYKTIYDFMQKGTMYAAEIKKWTQLVNLDIIIKFLEKDLDMVELNFIRNLLYTDKYKYDDFIHLIYLRFPQLRVNEDLYGLYREAYNYSQFYLEEKNKEMRKEIQCKS